MLLNGSRESDMRVALGAWSSILTEKKSRISEEHQASLQERLSYLESLLNDSADKQKKQMAAAEESRKSNMTKTVQMLLNGSRESDMRVALGAWSSILTEKKSRIS